MSAKYFDSKDYTRIDFTLEGFPGGEYELCTFSDCNFSGCDLSGVVFSECKFSNCNLSLVKTSQTAFREVSIRESKLLGVHFENCNPFLFSIDFDHCTLNLTSFYQLNLKKARFKHCNLAEADFTECNLIHSLFDDCDLSGAVFENTVLENADFRTSYNYSIDPEINRVKKARFSLAGIAGLLEKYGIMIE
jgi:fluoroquinolone resistance protein